MGNNSDICCTLKLTKQSSNQEQNQILITKREATKNRLSSINSFTNTQSPMLSQEISDMLSIKKPLKLQLDNVESPKIINWKDSIYQGEVQNNKPNGYGKLYLKNGSLLFSKFKNGEPIENFFFIKTDGSYCEGEISQNNKLSECTYKEKDFQFKGIVQNGLLDGKGTLYKKNVIITGDFNKGALKNGILKWIQNNQQYVYTGDLNQQLQMHGKGALKEPFGDYEGDFFNNYKHGDGKYTFRNGNAYIGKYNQNKKQGFGRLQNKFCQILYEGQWKDGIPFENDERKLQRIFSQKTLKMKKKTSISTNSSLKQVRHKNNKILQKKDLYQQ